MNQKIQNEKVKYFVSLGFPEESVLRAIEIYSFNDEKILQFLEEEKKDNYNDDIPGFDGTDLFDGLGLNLVDNQEKSQFEANVFERPDHFLENNQINKKDDDFDSDYILAINQSLQSFQNFQIDQFKKKQRDRESFLDFSYQIQNLKSNEKIREKDLPIGLLKLNQTSYFNSFLQSLNFIPQFLEQIFHFQIEENQLKNIENQNNGILSEEKIDILFFFFTIQKFFAYLSHSQSKFISSKPILSAINLLNQPFSDFQKTQISDFLSFFIRKCDEASEIAQDFFSSKKEIIDPFDITLPDIDSFEPNIKTEIIGEFAKIFTGKITEEKNQVKESIFNSIPFNPSYQSIYSSLEQFANTQKSDNLEKEFIFLPQILLFELDKNFTNQKISDNFHLEKTINLDKFVSKNIRNEKQETNYSIYAIFVQEKNNNNDENDYYVFIYNNLNSKWIKFQDDIVEEVTEDIVIKSSFKTDGAYCYCLIYLQNRHPSTQFENTNSNALDDMMNFSDLVPIPLTNEIANENKLLFSEISNNNQNFHLQKENQIWGNFKEKFHKSKNKIQKNLSVELVDEKKDPSLLGLIAYSYYNQKNQLMDFFIAQEVFSKQYPNENIQQIIEKNIQKNIQLFPWCEKGVNCPICNSEKNQLCSSKIAQLIYQEILQNSFDLNQISLLQYQYSAHVVNTEQFLSALNNIKENRLFEALIQIYYIFIKKTIAENLSKNLFWFLQIIITCLIKKLIPKIVSIQSNEINQIKIILNIIKMISKKQNDEIIQNQKEIPNNKWFFDFLFSDTKFNSIQILFVQEIQKRINELSNENESEKKIIQELNLIHNHLISPIINDFEFETKIPIPNPNSFHSFIDLSEKYKELFTFSKEFLKKEKEEIFNEKD
ncbi:ubiquitin carboxyl-terminal hydrolase [Anaeramoeba ignava]|uniref:Ubiquitin carboxyl-terminal hydrolase n=1 Tax=Anaeramoeba ignava TaxID=1746090 RepID=A0A9Q0L6S3_ANAIG|nr:ubiquitin carboxyl-terminal hydrolase [Anaeramoeba ignava]